jgi:hypothetical protein
MIAMSSFRIGYTKWISYGMAVSEESRAAEEFLARNSYRPNSISHPAKRIRKPPTKEELDRMSIHANAAEKRFKGGPLETK